MAMFITSKTSDLFCLGAREGACVLSSRSQVRLTRRQTPVHSFFLYAFSLLAPSVH